GLRLDHEEELLVLDDLALPPVERLDLRRDVDARGETLVDQHPRDGLGLLLGARRRQHDRVAGFVLRHAVDSTIRSGSITAHWCYSPRAFVSSAFAEGARSRAAGKRRGDDPRGDRPRGP